VIKIHIAIALWAILAAIYWGDWKNFKKYYPTMLFVIAADLLYKIFALNNYHLWRIQKDYIINHITTYLLYVLITFSLSTFVFLSTYPTTLKKQMVHILKWVFIYSVVEWIGWKFGRITYYHGWSIWWSIFFNVNMFIMMRIHYVNYLWAIPLSIICTFFYLLVFNYI
jgi:hypothetical protein